MNFTTFRTAVSLSVLATAAVLSGCADKTPVLINDQFRPDDEPRAVDNVFAQMRANGAREDGTLYVQHFTDGQLNSLGYEKLSAMAYGPSTGRLSIYLDVPKGNAYDSQLNSVTKALARGGFAEDAYTITAGPNPNVGAPAVQGLSALAKQHGGESNDSAPAASSEGNLK